ncbi:putative 2-iminobutanoate/2-iminopropanoate deaminase [Hyphomicrobiales bacterium]|nr:putative 2-iminobutanoate/2-iminopropanoate deaminase [Hyphomicrobiales bacterium]CAH1702146.1 putative 2-iminobutanoate/2-iminopropanoate deaminase [Hyphomicrobiales bacterium]CAI0346352.1 2-iminobutanoate/2-iminopropanoate deaminase [Hyphomicrobiales bacterium]
MEVSRLMPTPIMHRAVASNGSLSLGGIIADDRALPMFGQTSQILAKLKAILEQSGSSMDRLISTTVFITDMGQKAEMDRAWKELIPQNSLPTRATIGVNDLGKGVLIEVVATASV